MFTSLFQHVAKVLIAPTLWLLGVAGYQVPTSQQLSAYQAQAEQQYTNNNIAYGSVQPIAGQTYSLSGGGISSSATTITLTSFTIKQTGQPIQTSDLVGSSGTFYVTIEPGSNTKQEIVGCTGVTQAATYASFTGCTRGLSPIYPYTASSTLQFSHAGGSSVVFSDPPQLFNQYAAYANAGTFTNQITFSVPPIGINPGGQPNSSETVNGVGQLSTAAQAGAGTSVGSTGARLLLPASLATSTCQTAAFSVLVSSSTTGKLNPPCLDTSYPYNFTGTTTFATTTVNGAITFNSTVTGIPSISPYLGGSDGAATLDGSATVSWATKSGNYYTMTRDVYLTNLTVNSNITLQTGNFRIYGTGIFTNTGTTTNPAIYATSFVGQQSGLFNVATGTLAIGTSGGGGGGVNNSCTGLNGGVATGVQHALGGAGGAGGQSCGAGGAGGAGSPFASYVVAPNLIQTLYMMDASSTGATPYFGGGGGGGGGGCPSNNGGNYGGGGGAGGNILFVAFTSIVNNGNLSAPGGNGATTNCAGFQASGGGGGGGGAVVLITHSHTNNGTESAPGGTGGASVNGGGASTNGTAGKVYVITI